MPLLRERSRLTARQRNQDLFQRGRWGGGVSTPSMTRVIPEPDPSTMVCAAPPELSKGTER
jgi:hypothetical protein